MTELQQVKQILTKYSVDNEALAIELAILVIEAQKAAMAALMNR